LLLLQKQASPQMPLNSGVGRHVWVVRDQNCQGSYQRLQTTKATGIRMNKFWGWLIVIFGLAACGGGSSVGGEELTDPSVCITPLGGGMAIAAGISAPECIGCETADEQNTIDGDIATFATMTYPPTGSGSQTIIARAQQGVVFPQGSNAAAYLSFENGVSGTITVRLYLGDQMVGESIVECQFCNQNNTSPQWYGVSPEDAFDMMEVEITDTQLGMTREMRVLELCPDTD
jgi:hypothetical protein